MCLNEICRNNDFEKYKVKCEWCELGVVHVILVVLGRKDAYVCKKCFSLYLSLGINKFVKDETMVDVCNPR